jgi:hypothetical protein
VKLSALALIASAVAGAHAQNTAGQVVCRGQRIDSITVDAQAPSVSGLRRVPVLGDFVRETHVITRHEVIRAYLLLRVGDRCNELRRSESERILRSQPFLADATIEVLSNDRGGVDLNVSTLDETSIVLGGAVSGDAPIVRAVKAGSGNLSGLGISGTVVWRHQPTFDDRVELRIDDYQFAGRPNVLSMSVTRDALGRDDRAQLTLPFRTDLQRFAWRTLIGESRGHVAFEQRDSGRLVLGYAREFAEGGGIVRIGPPGQLALFGLSFTNERAYPDSGAELLTATSLLPDTAALFAGRFGETRSARINALIGLRGLRFMRVRAFDALRGTQDIPLGVQFGTLVGRSVPAFGANFHDVFVATDVYIGVGMPRLTYQLQLQGEGRRPRGIREWDNVVGSARLSRHSRPSDARTRILTFEWSGTSRVLVPHSLSLGVPESGLRGFRDATAIGGRRAIVRFDEQLYAGSPFGFGDVGFAVFSDIGKLWAGDMPYAAPRLPTRVSAGGSLLVAVPVRSTRMWRLEYAVPLNPEPGSPKWQIRLSHRDVTSFFWREPMDVDAARARAVPASIFNWP